ncbi:ABC transporter substrate-binding protein [Rathayibacter sp. VKM Ac-2929]|uniref:ABC transporter substrate-binding protein n=1 Tax=Rathayibacter sp. VKM Ac-2929 TaxID=2929480 RepID=UPI001FB3CA8A|nr:ABC transporter substrate-binding protein [Rathayibacter sp. VKM Ac-2929]MCJ1675513.1 ABC transporter substrate-binding protein [Rathayibacter sp. VKM Ac-2929]
MNHFRSRRSRVIGTVLVGGLITSVLAGCASAEEAGARADGSTGVVLDSDLVASAGAKAAEIAEPAELDGTIELIGPNGGNEGAILEAVYAPFEEATGVDVKYTGTQDYISVVQSRVQADNPPDMASMSLGVFRQYASTMDLVSVTEVVGAEELASSYSGSLLDAVTFDGEARAVFQGFSNFMMWYNPQTYTGPTEDASWDEVMAWTDSAIAAGETPWCAAQESGASSGFPGAQFIETLFAKKYGPDKLAAWGSGELAWTSPEVKDAFEMFGAIATNDAAVNGGVTGALSEPISTGSNGLVTDLCSAEVWGSFTAGLIAGSTDVMVPGENLDFMQVPGSTPEFAETEIFQTEGTFAFNDTPETRALLAYIASTEAQTLLASADQWTVSNLDVPVDTYDSVLLQRAAETFINEDVTFGTGISTLAGSDVRSALYKGVVAYMQDPASLDSVLQSIQDTVSAS